MIGSIEKKIKLELGESGVQERITARQGDSLIHRISISLTSGGVPYRLTDVFAASVWAILPNGEAITAGCEIRDDKCVFVPGSGFFEAGGPVICRLVLMGDNGAELFSPAFSIDAEGDGYGGMERAEAKEYSKIGEVLLQVLDIKRQCEELVTVGG
ncbi:MAG: hypothetical protein IKU19_06290, partial [Clostridia bacterium]|nr:hypothetical protein [Clostridia bacterium]